jgi:hypothetical protein
MILFKKTNKKRTVTFQIEILPWLGVGIATQKEDQDRDIILALPFITFLATFETKKNECKY